MIAWTVVSLALVLLPVIAICYSTVAVAHWVARFFLD